MVISWALGSGEGAWMWKHFIYEIQAIVKEMDIVLSHIARSQNGEADRLAKWGREQPEAFKGNSYPEWDDLM